MPARSLAGSVVSAGRCNRPKVLPSLAEDRCVPTGGSYLANLPQPLVLMSAAARRAVGTVAAGRRVEARGGQRLGRQAWLDIRRACRLGNENERVRAVTVHGVHIAFSCAPFCHGGIVGHEASQELHAAPAMSLGQQERVPRPPNSRQRRSAKRLEKFLHGKEASAEAAAAEAAAEAHALRAEAPAFSPPKPVEIDEPMDAEAPASPRREQQQMLMEASEALTSKAQAVSDHRPPVSEPRPIRQFRRPNT